jgi:type I restriction enzyme S subunit
MSRESIYLDLSDLQCVALPPSATEGSRTQLVEGDVLISITADIGITCYVDAHLSKPAYINQHVALVRFDPSIVDSKYIAYYLASEAPQRGFRSGTDQGAKAGMNLAAVRAIQLVLPPLPEQRAIAAALSDVDALIAALDDLIAKKKDLKAATMQQLLTGQRRLPGFTSAWQATTFGAIGQFSKGQGLPKEALGSAGDLPAVPYTAIYTDYGEVFRVADVKDLCFRASAQIVVCAPCLLIASSSNMLVNVGKAAAFDGGGEIAVGGDVLIFSSREDHRFLSYLLSLPAHRRRVVLLSQGSTIRHVYRSTFLRYEIVLPEMVEQCAISEVITGIDSEIAALEARREKTKLLKQGMMQELLTGRTRLVDTK